MAVPTRITDLSATAGSNPPSGGDTIGTSLDDYFRAAFQIIRGDLASKGADIASAATTDLGAVQGLFHDITGTTTITSFGTVAAGIWKVLQFDGALTLTHNATSLIIPGGANITTAAGDMCMVTSEGAGNWRMNWFFRAASMTVTLSGTETLTNKTLTSPTITGGTATQIPISQNSQSAAYTTVLADGGKHILHPAADNVARTFTIDSNANVAYPIGTAITFVNEINTVTIAITTDTLTFALDNSTGSRTLAAGGIATALKITSTKWIISGTGLS
jgi:hypothetical protein